MLRTHSLPGRCATKCGRYAVKALSASLPSFLATRREDQSLFFPEQACDVFWDYTPRGVLVSVAQSLTRLKTNTIEVLQIHDAEHPNALKKLAAAGEKTPTCSISKNWHCNRCLAPRRSTSRSLSGSLCHCLRLRWTQCVASKSEGCTTVSLLEGTRRPSCTTGSPRAWAQVSTTSCARATGIFWINRDTACLPNVSGVG